MKKVFLPMLALMASVAFTSCNNNPQDKAQAEANKEMNAADRQESMASDHMETGMDHAETAAEHRTMAELNQAMADVQVPTFDKMASNELVKKIGNNGVDFVNANNYQEAGKFADKIKGNLAELDKKVAEGKISDADATQIRTYANNLATAVGLQIN